MLKRSITFSIILLAIGIFVFAAFQKSASTQKVAGISTRVKTQNIRGIILPHHDLAREYIVASLERISKNQNPKTVVIIGPNHYEPQAAKFISATNVLDYPVQEEFVNRLYMLQKTTLNQAAVENDHSIITPLSYLKNYFPDAEFIPLLAPPYFDTSDISQIAMYLSRSLPQDTLFVASVDFSHNTQAVEASTKNRQSEETIKNFDFETLYQYKDDHIDSPSSIGLLLSTMQRLGSTTWELWYDSHGAFIEDKAALQGTSYLIGVFTQK